MIQTVKELIDELKKCNPNYPVRIYFNDDIKEIELVDNTLQDRVDINMLEEDKVMKLRQAQKTKIERMLDEIEYYLEAMEQQEYMTFDLEKDLRRLSAMLDDVREEIEKK